MSLLARLSRAIATLFTKTAVARGIATATSRPERELERPEDVRHLATLLCAADPTLAGQAAARVLDWLQKVRPNDLPRVDEAFRWISFRFDPDSAGWSHLSREQLHRLCEDPVRRLPLLLCASFHHSGFVREAAIRGLCPLETREAFACVILRVNDWVPAVRRAAETALADLSRSGAAAHVVANLPLVLRLREAGRQDHSGLVERLLGVVSRAGDGKLLLGALRSKDRAVALACLDLTSASRDLDVSEVLREAAASSEPMVRLAAVRKARSLPDGALVPVDVLGRWRRDLFSAVRREALLFMLERRPDDVLQAAEEALFDYHAGIRSLARFALGHHGVSDVGASYRDVLRGPLSDRTAAALCGIGETGGWRTPLSSRATWGMPLFASSASPCALWPSWTAITTSRTWWPPWRARRQASPVKRARPSNAVRAGPAPSACGPSSTRQNTLTSEGMPWPCSGSWTAGRRCRTW